ncbi:CHAT domain-containing protein [Calothrix sp. 336/3]|uniref:CHAT domain-containing protein n=1 Tax=Calothrix sp. 336/3 TaxID=1337936 RepID=UPI0004E2CAA6|nr:CHAT domain-containing protein [Calothrix sp. 336/3]AKG22186.1 hypothetical protein IJ00_13775 [Calothrix sp. 336/3]
MQRRQILQLLPFSLTLWTSTVYGANQPEDIVKLFDMAASKHRRELGNLWQMRGTPRIRLSNVSSQSIARVLAIAPTNSSELTYPRHTCVLFYSYDKDNLQTWLLKDSGIEAYHRQTISKDTLTEAITALRNSLNVDTLQRSRMARPKRANQILPLANDNHTRVSCDRAISDLTQILLPTPIAQAIATARHLILVPTLDIGTVPYAILQPFPDKSFLIEQMSISIAPSLFDIGQTLHTWMARRVFKSPLIIGNPYIPPSIYWSVPPLPGAEEEAQAIAKILNEPPLIGKEATKTEILSRVTQASLLYIATHGVASTHSPLSESFLMLSADKIEKGWWTAKEIQSLKLNASIAILSACQTGLGQAHDAGIIGLSRAFQIAGVPRVVMSLWSVDDQATNKLMQTFVKHLETHIPAEALRQAMLEAKQQYADPSQWASFVIFGTPR